MKTNQATETSQTNKPQPPEQATYSRELYEQIIARIARTPPKMVNAIYSNCINVVKESDFNKGPAELPAKV